MPPQLTVHCTLLCGVLGGSHLAAMCMLLWPGCFEITGFSLLFRLRSVVFAVSAWLPKRPSSLLALDIAVGLTSIL